MSGNTQEMLLKASSTFIVSGIFTAM
ncbi:hypothetical protein NC652_017063 [Populus alba x Populus x berolinensis]|nr:hypothetical protein NC652_017063 [Populus alba x Populus x berolinensis]